MLSSLTITKHDGSSTVQVSTKVEDTATLSTLRTIAEKEGIMSASDQFMTRKSGSYVRKNTEKRLAWANIQDREDKSVHINVGGKDVTSQDDLSDSQKTFL
ncbi:hypothetical protein M407DRAFT_221313, partial [Tulasnella calospora MUT 4182]